LLRMFYIALLAGSTDGGLLESSHTPAFYP
jgi:hypothetical protein